MRISPQTWTAAMRDWRSAEAFAAQAAARVAMAARSTWASRRDSRSSPSKGRTRFAAGVGTVLFYEDQDTVKGLQENFPLYADAFPTFSEHSAGMAQISSGDLFGTLKATKVGSQGIRLVIDQVQP